MEILAAHHQWATRPADQRFTSLEAMHEATKRYAAQAEEATRPWSGLTVDAEGDDVVLQGPNGGSATLTHYAFGQLCARAQAPASFLRELPAGTAALALRDRLAARTDGSAQMLFHANGKLVVRALTSENYVRVWNHEVIERTMDAAARFDLVPGRQTMTWDGSPLPPESERPPALYASDHDCFLFMMSRNRGIMDPTGNVMYRGVIIGNSEVGASSLKIMSFLFRDVCANHIIWNARELAEIRLTHRGQIRQRWHNATLTIRKYLDGAASEEEASFRETFLRIGDAATKDDVLDAVFAKRIPGLTRKVLSEGYDATVPDVDGQPHTKWGLAQGLTRYSQTLGHTDERQQIDRGAGKLLSVAF